MSEMSFVVTTQQTNVSTAITGMAAQTGRRGWATLPPIIQLAMGARKKRCIRYMPKVNFATPVSSRGASVRCMQLKSKKAPNVAHSTLGIQNSHPHSSIGVSMACPGVPFHQKLQAVKAAPAMRHTVPTTILLPRDHERWKRM